MTGVRAALSATIVCVFTALAVLSRPQLHAQEKWPSKRVTLVVPVGARPTPNPPAHLLAE
jgi:tripartite-type tricarboxylate transporter receptor subunit TctC